MPDATPKSTEAPRPEERSAFLFDRVFYLAANPDLGVLAAGPDFDPEDHFWREGIWDGRQPSSFYDVDHLQRALKSSAFGPVSRGQALPLFFTLPPAERPVPNAWFNPAFFRAHHAAELPEAAGLADFPLFEFYAANAGPLRLSPNALFDEAGYQARHPDVAARIAAGAIASGFQHFVSTGWREGRVAVAGAWIGREPDVAMKRAERDALLAGGAAASMAWWFDEEFYLAIHRDVEAIRRAGTVRSGLEHFLRTGFAERRAPHPALARLFRARPDDTPIEALLEAIAAESGMLASGLPLAEAVALRAQVLEKGWSTDEAALTEYLWDLVAPAALSGRFDPAAYLAANPDVAVRVAEGVFADAASHWRLRGMAEGRLAPFANPFAGRRASLRELARGGAGANYLGPLSLATEAGGAARDMVAALEAGGIAVAAIDISGLHDARARLDMVAPDALPHGFTLVDLAPEHVTGLAARFGAGLLDRRMAIALFPPGAPGPAARSVLGGFDAILAPGEWSEAALRGVTGRTVLSAPRPIDAARLRRLAQTARHPVLDRLRAERGAGRRVVLFSMGPDLMRYREAAEARGLDLFLALARAMEASEPGAWCFCVKAESRSATDPGLAPLLGDAPVLLVHEPWGEAQLAALRAGADVAIFPDRVAGNERAALTSIVLGVPTLVAMHGDLAAVLGPDYPLAIPARPIGDGRFEPDPAALATRLAEHLASPRRFRPWPKRVATRLDPATLGPALHALLAAQCGLDGQLDGLGTTLDAATDQEFALSPRPADADLAAAIAGARRPLFSVVAPIAGAALQAELAAQEHPGWRLSLVRGAEAEPPAVTALKQADARISVAADEAAALALAPGEFLLFPAAGDRLDPALLAAFAARIAAEPTLDLLHCDDAAADADGLGTPDWSPERLVATFYPGRSLCIRAALLFRLGGLPDGLGPAALHDLVLRALASGARVAHVPGALHRPAPVQLDGAAEAATIRALEAHLARLDLSGSAEPGLLPGTFRIRPQIRAERVSAVIFSGCERAPTAEGPVLHVERFLRSMLAHGTGMPLEFDIVVDRGREAEVAHLKRLDPTLRIVPFDPLPGGFNFSAKANAAIRAAQGDTVILLNDDMEALDDGWARALLEPLELPGVGVVGAQLRYPDGSLQHAGIALGGPEATWHPFVGTPEHDARGRGFIHTMRNAAAVTAACMAFRRGTFEQAGGFDERFAIDFNDTDFCLRVLQTGLRIVYTPFARLRHHESQTVVRARADALERRRFERRWQDLIRRDPYAPSGYASGSRGRDGNLAAESERAVADG